MNSFTLERTVLPEHLDTLNHVNNVQYLYWVQEAAQAHWEALIAHSALHLHLGGAQSSH